MVARDIIDNKEMDLNTVYACCTGTTKHVGTSFTEPDYARDALEMLFMMAGGEKNGENGHLFLIQIVLLYRL